MKSNSRTGGLLLSGIIFSFAYFLVGLGNYAFQAIMGRQLGRTEFGLTNTTISFTGLLGLPLAIATTAVTHYIARFHFSGDDARLHGLLAGCRKFLFHITVGRVGRRHRSRQAVGRFFHIPAPASRSSRSFACSPGFGARTVTALCQGLGWFKRLAFIGLLAVPAAFVRRSDDQNLADGRMGGVRLRRHAAGQFDFVVLEKGFSAPDGTIVSPWTEFVQFLIVSAACVLGNCFSQGDLLVAKNIFPARSWMPTLPPGCSPAHCRRPSARC